MSSGVMKIWKEVEKKEYAKSPLGIVEKQIGKIYEDLKKNKKALSEEVAKKVYDVREENEKWQMDYINLRIKEDRKAVDAKLLESMSKELDILKENGYGN